jgi:hypothetical protein
MDNYKLIAKRKNINLYNRFDIYLFAIKEKPKNDICISTHFYTSQSTCPAHLRAGSDSEGVSSKTSLGRGGAS